MNATITVKGGFAVAKPPFTSLGNLKNFNLFDNLNTKNTYFLFGTSILCS